MLLMEGSPGPLFPVTLLPFVFWDDLSFVPYTGPTANGNGKDDYYLYFPLYETA
jgi:hypothetical protein